MSTRPEMALNPMMWGRINQMSGHLPYWEREITVGSTEP
jgi:hypothetical protein